MIDLMQCWHEQPSERPEMKLGIDKLMLSNDKAESEMDAVRKQVAKLSITKEKAAVSCKNDFENNKIIGDGKNKLSRSKLLAFNEILVNIFVFEYFSAKNYFIK